MNEQKQFKFKLGADPEFVILLHKNRLSAKKLIANIFGNRELLSNDGQGFAFEGGSIGWDSSPGTGELRPNPNNSPAGLVNNIMMLVKKLAEKTPFLEYSTKSKGAPVGGHIHFEIPNNMQNSRLEEIHRQLMSFYWPIMMSEDQVNMFHRMRLGYGRIEQWKANGENKSAKTYEFRVPSAEWLTTPKIASATLAYLGVVFHECLHNQKRIKQCKHMIHETTQQGKAIQELTMAKFRPLTQIIMRSVAREIRKFEMYPVFKNEIEYILNPDKVIKEKEKTDFDLLKGWNQVKKSPTKKELTNETKVKSKKIEPLEAYKEVIEIDRTVKNSEIVEFIEAIKDRILNMGWKIKKDYIIEKLRDGIENPIIMNAFGEYIMGHEIIGTKADKTRLEEYVRSIVNDRRIPNMYIGMNQNDKEHEWANKANKLQTLKETIIVLLPSKMIENHNKRAFISLIYDLEKELPKPIAINENELTDDRITGQPGLIAKLYSNNQDQRNNQVRNLVEATEEFQF